MAGTSTVGALPPMEHRLRRDRLRRSLADAGCEVLLVTAPNDVRYLTGFTGSNGVLLIGLDPSKDTLVSDARYRERIGDLDVPMVELERRLETIIGQLGHVAVGVDAEHVTLAAAQRLEAAREGAPLVRTAGLVGRLRAGKDAAEVARIRAACHVTASVLEDLAGRGLTPGTSERAVARDVEQAFLDRGADGVAFPTIVASGPNGASPHHGASDRLLRPGDLVTIDCGAEVDGYRADMTRTLPVGKVRGRLAEVHAIVEAANGAGRAAAQVEGEVAAVDRAARGVVEDAGYGEAFVHPTGHGIGLDVHEAPLVTERSTASLAVGTTFTVEPGIYLPGIGGVRIEDSLVVLPDTVDVLTVMERRLTGP
jgi:Xaa-Pro aminopeptidase